MKTCEYWFSCALFDEFQERRSLHLDEIKDEYCADNFSRCARYIIHRTHGPRKIPISLFPDDIPAAHKILDDLEIKLASRVESARVQQKIDRLRFIPWLVVSRDNSCC